VSILDIKFLVISEYALNQRISIFDDNGKFIKLIKAYHSVFDPIALKNNKIAYFSYKTDESSGTRKVLIFIRDINTGKEAQVASFFKKVRKTALHAAAFESKIFLSRTKEGNLLVGFSDSPEISSYSSEGKKNKFF